MGDVRADTDKRSSVLQVIGGYSLVGGVAIALAVGFPHSSIVLRLSCQGLRNRALAVGLGAALLVPLRAHQSGLPEEPVKLYCVLCPEGQPDTERKIRVRWRVIPGDVPRPHSGESGTSAIPGSTGLFE